VPLPVPLLPAVIVIQAEPLVATQLVPRGPVTLTDPVPASALCERLKGEIENDPACPACVMVKVWPAIVSVPVRSDVFGLAETE